MPSNQDNRGQGHGGSSGPGGGQHGPGGGDQGGGHGSQRIGIFVNDHAVYVTDERQTGASIKQAAIAQKVQIGADFILSIERGGGKTDLVGDDEAIKVHKGDRFLAIQNDDNS
ncbi:MAG: multiubiquitin domain-containing protein [Hyphomicrobium sp.]